VSQDYLIAVFVQAPAVSEHVAGEIGASLIEEIRRHGFEATFDVVYAPAKANAAYSEGLAEALELMNPLDGGAPRRSSASCCSGSSSPSS
jgi:hypothetical protein